jgi:hypothetical protein
LGLKAESAFCLKFVNILYMIGPVLVGQPLLAVLFDRSAAAKDSQEWLSY